LENDRGNSCLNATTTDKSNVNMSTTKGKATTAKDGKTSLPQVTPSKDTSSATLTAQTKKATSTHIVGGTAPIVAKTNEVKNTKPSASSGTPKLPSIQPKVKAGALPKGAVLKEAPNATETVSSVESASNTEATKTEPSNITDQTTIETTPIVTSQPEKSTEGATLVTAEITPQDAPVPAPAPIIMNNNGKVILIYEQYNEQFDIKHGSTTQENIDEVYCLSFVMPNCLIHLSSHPPAIKRQLEGDGKLDELYLPEYPRGAYQGLEDNQTYYVYVEQEAEQLQRDQEIMRLRAVSMEGAAKSDPSGLSKDDGRVLESCSCIYGNPCVDEYGCKDWDNRYAIAMKNGWKGF